MGFDSPPKQQPQMKRAIREVILDSTVSTNSKGGLDVSLKATKTAGNDKVRAVGSVFAAGNTNGGAITKGASVGAAILNKCLPR